MPPRDRVTGATEPREREADPQDFTTAPPALEGIGNHEVSARLREERAGDGPGRGRAPAALVSAVLGGAGNQMVGAYLARAGPGGAVKHRPKPRDVKSFSDAELEQEMDRVGSRLVDTDPEDPRWKGLFDRSGALHDEYNRRYEAREARERAEEGHADAMKLIGDAERANTELKGLVGFLDEELTDAEKHVREYLGYYNEAYDHVVDTLGTAKKDAAFRESIINFCTALAIGTGLGLAGGALFESVKGLGKVLVELGGELTEAGAANATQAQSAVSFELPKGLEPGTRASVAWERMSDAWKGAALLNTSLLDFGDYRDHLREIAGELAVLAQGGSGPRTADELAKELQRIKMQAFLPLLWLRMTDTRRTLIEFLQAIRHPLLRKIAYEIEQDIWIGWISGLRGTGENAGKNQYGMPIPPWMDPRVHEALDEDAIENRLERIGLIGERSRLGVDFGWNTTAGDTADAYEAATREQKRLQQLGRFGIAITPIKEGKPGVVHIRRTAYELAGRDDPDPSMPEGYFRAVSFATSSEKGQVVRVEGTSKDGVEVMPVPFAEQKGHVSGEDEEQAKSAQ